MVNPVRATSNFSEVQNIDLVLICVKTWQLKEVAKIINNNIGENSVIISLLNGVENEDILCSEISKNNVLGGLCKVVSKVEDYGVINHMSYEPTIVFGELNINNSKRAVEIEQTFKKAGINAVLTNNIQQEIWTKFFVNI